MGLVVETTTLPDGNVRLALRSRRLAYGVRVDAPGFLPSDDGFFIEPGGEREVILRVTDAQSSLDGGKLTALNMHDCLELA